MTDQQPKQVLLVDGPLAGQWREAPSGQAHARFFENIDPATPYQITPFSADYKLMDVTVRIGSNEYRVTVGATEPRPDLKELIIRQLFTREAANVLLGFEVTT